MHSSMLSAGICRRPPPHRTCMHQLPSPPCLCVLCRSTLGGVLNIAGMLFASTLFVGFTNAMTVQHTVEVQR